MSPSLMVALPSLASFLQWLHLLLPPCHLSPQLAHVSIYSIQARIKAILHLIYLMWFRLGVWHFDQCPAWSVHPTRPHDRAGWAPRSVLPSLWRRAAASLASSWPLDPSSCPYFCWSISVTFSAIRYHQTKTKSNKSPNLNAFVDLGNGGYQCRDQSCIKQTQVCDFNQDCQMNDDEKDCGICNFDVGESKSLPGAIEGGCNGNRRG